MLDLRRLRILAELRRLGTVTAVADSLHYTHSAVSQQLAACERDAGARLTERVGRRLRLTEQGEVLADYAERMLALADEAASAVAASTSQVHGTIRVTSFQTVLSSLLPAALTQLAVEFPELTVEVIQHDMYTAAELLVRREVDLILGEDYPGDVPPTDGNMHRETLTRDPMYLITPETGPWSGLELPELEGVPFAIDPPDQAVGHFARALCRRHGFEPNFAFQTPDPFLHAHLVRGGHAVSIVPELLLPNIFGVRVVELPGRPARTLYTAVSVGREHHPALVAFRAARAAAAR